MEILDYFTTTTIRLAHLKHKLYTKSVKNISIVALVLALLLSVTAYAEDEYTIGYGCLEDKQCLPVECKDILVEAYSRIGKKVQFRQLPLLRDLEDANSALIDASSYRAKETISRFSNLEIVPVPLLMIEQVAFTTEADVKIASWKELHQYHVGVLRGDLFINDTAEQKGIRLYQVGSIDQGLKMMEQGRLDAVIGIKSLGINIAAKLDIHVQTSVALLSYHVYHAVKKKYSHIIPALEESFSGMISDGTMERLLGDYRDMMVPLSED